MIDIDHFKQVNDTHGHQKGDQVLREVARTLQLRTRRSDFIGRFGGEEFLALLSDPTADGVVIALERFRRAVERMVVPDLPRVTISLGAVMADECRSARHAFEKADAAMYKAKQRGRNCWELS